MDTVFILNVLFDIIQDLYAYFQMLFNEILRDVFVRFGCFYSVGDHGTVGD